MSRFVLLFAVVTAFAGFLRPALAGDAVLEDTKARKLYLTKCAKCHKLYEPKKYSDADWEKWMGKMTKKSKLNSAQTELLTRYLETLRNETNATNHLMPQPPK